LFFLLFLIPTYGFPITISTEVVEPISGRTIAEVRNTVISKALRIALEEAALRISPNLSDESLEKLKGKDFQRNIKAYRILSEISTGEDYKVSLEVDVNSEELKKGIGDLAVYDRGTFSEIPSVSITIIGNPESNPIVKTLPTSDVKREISTVLIGSGYRVIMDTSSDIRLEAYMGIRTTENRSAESAYYNTIGNVYIRARDRNGKFLTEVSDSSYLTGSNLREISLNALKIAGAGAAKKLRSELNKTQLVKKDEPGGGTGAIEVLFTGLRNYAQYERMDDIMAKSVPGISINKRVFRRGGEVSFLVFSRVNPEELARSIQGLLPVDMSFKLEDASYDKIKFSVYYNH